MGFPVREYGTITDTAGYWGFYREQWGHYHRAAQTGASGDTLSFFPFGFTYSKIYNRSNEGDNTFVEWGTQAEVKSSTVNGIPRGIGDHWRTITADEWSYLLFQRPMVFGAPRFAAVVVTLANGRTQKNCLILYPDRYNPSDLEPKPNVRGVAQPVTWNEYQQYESLGCAFLPANGFRNNGAAINSNASNYELVCLYHSCSRYTDVSDTNYMKRSRGIVGDLSMPASRGDNMAMGGLAFSCGHNVRLMMNEENGPVESSTPIL